MFCLTSALPTLLFLKFCKERCWMGVALMEQLLLALHTVFY